MESTSFRLPSNGPHERQWSKSPPPHSISSLTRPAQHNFPTDVCTPSKDCFRRIRQRPSGRRWRSIVQAAPSCHQSIRHGPLSLR